MRSIAVPLGWGSIFAVWFAIVIWGCGSPEDEVRGRMTPAPPEVVSSAAGISAASPFHGGDPARLRFDGRARDVLVHAGENPFITVDEYNAWLGTYPMKITAQDQSGAQQQALEQMVTFKLLVQKARESGSWRSASAQGVIPDDSDLAVGYIRAWVTNTSSVSDAEALAYEQRESGRLAEISNSELPAQLKMMGLKGSVRGEQLWAQVKVWMEEAEIQYHTDV